MPFGGYGKARLVELAYCIIQFFEETPWEQGLTTWTLTPARRVPDQQTPKGSTRPWSQALGNPSIVSSRTRFSPASIWHPHGPPHDLIRLDLTRATIYPIKAGVSGGGIIVAPTSRARPSRRREPARGARSDDTKPADTGIARTLPPVLKGRELGPRRRILFPLPWAP